MCHSIDMGFECIDAIVQCHAVARLVHVIQEIKTCKARHCVSASCVHGRAHRGRTCAANWLPHGARLSTGSYMTLYRRILKKFAICLLYCLSLGPPLCPFTRLIMIKRESKFVHETKQPAIPESDLTYNFWKDHQSAFVKDICEKSSFVASESETEQSEPTAESKVCLNCGPVMVDPPFARYTIQPYKWWRWKFTETRSHISHHWFRSNAKFSIKVVNQEPFFSISLQFCLPSHKSH